MAEGTLAGRAILAVEDEYWAATDLRRELVKAGATVLGPAPSLERATDLIESAPRIDGAILDINLRGEMVFPAADLLRKQGVPFLFATGYDQSMIPARFDDVLRCEKPIGADMLCRSLLTIIRRAT
jgi:DNA-binding response OmpR family regulator